MIPRTLEEILTELRGRIGRLERRVTTRPIGYEPEPPYVLPPQYAQMGRGTTVQRDAIWPVPSTDPQRAALANTLPTWFNTDLGWEESYYAPTGLAGLTRLGLLAGTPADWYPTGLGPECILQPTSAATSSSGTFLGGWNGAVVRRGGAAWFTPDPLGIVINKPGTWDLSAWTIQQTGTGIATFALRVMDAPGTTVLASRHHAAEPLQSVTETPAEYRMTSVTKGLVQCLFYTVAGSLAVHQNAAGSPGVRGQMIARYLRPPFVTQ